MINYITDVNSDIVKKISATALPAPTIITGGNSLTHMGGARTTMNAEFSRDDNWFYWAKGFVGPRFLWLANVAISGETVRQQINRLEAEVFPLKPDYYNFMEGTNSVNQYRLAGKSFDETVTLTIADFDELISKVLARGIRLILMTIPPRADYDYNRNAMHERINHWLRWRAATTQGITLVDAWVAMVDPLNAGMNAKTNFLKADNLHFTPRGARALGRAWADATAHIWTFPLLYVSAANSWHRGASTWTRRMNSNAFFTGSGGEQIGVGLTGGPIAAGCRAGMQGTFSAASIAQVTRADGFGNNQRVTASGCAAGAFSIIGTSTTAHNAMYTAGDYVKGFLHVSLSGMTNVKGVYPYVTYQIGGSTTYIAYGMNPQAASVAEYDQTDFSMWIETPFATFSSGTVSLLSLSIRTEFMSAGGAATMDVGRMEFLNLGPNISIPSIP